MYGSYSVTYAPQTRPNLPLPSRRLGCERLSASQAVRRVRTSWWSTGNLVHDSQSHGRRQRSAERLPRMQRYLMCSLEDGVHSSGDATVVQWSSTTEMEGIAAIPARTIPALEESERLRRVCDAISGQTRDRWSWILADALPGSGGLSSTTQKVEWVCAPRSTPPPSERHRPSGH